MNLHIRTAYEGEFDNLIDIYRREGIDINRNNLVKNIKSDFQKSGENRTIWFGKVRGQTIGAVQLVFNCPEKDLANGRDIAMIHHLRVAKEFLGQGLGSKLNNVVETVANNRNIKTLTLEVEKTNKKAQEIYKHWGYNFLRRGKNSSEIVMFKK